jgi:hypothetical protein
MGKIQDTLDWFAEKAEKVKDTFGTGVEAFNVSGEKAKDMMGIARPQ